MKKPTKLERSKLKEHFAEKVIRVIGRISFEDRSVSILSDLVGVSLTDRLFFYSKNESTKAIANRANLHFTDDEQVLLDTTDPLMVYDAISSSLRKYLSDDRDCELLIDITSFRREELLILLLEVAMNPAVRRDHTHIIYTSANSMGKWLSREVNEIHSVVGFSGQMDPRKQTHLILLLGFEDHRAKAIIEAYEPAKITLGISNQEGSINNKLYDRNMDMRNRIVRLFDLVTKEFEFSATDPMSVVNSLEILLKIDDGFNVVVAPLHTKLSTVGVGLYALVHPEIQVCYANVHDYNRDSYSVTGKHVYVQCIDELKLPHI